MRRMSLASFRPESAVGADRFLCVAKTSVSGLVR
jgi:hypothetical protein